MSERRRYTAKQKAAAVGIAAAEGVTEAERQTGIPKSTIFYWESKPEFAQLRTTAREEVIEQFWVGVQVGLREVIKGIEGDASLKEKADALRVMSDRYALLSGGATGRYESRDITGTISDMELVAAILEAESIVTGEGDEEEDPGAPEG
jgi:hypothetical protein